MARGDLRPSADPDRRRVRQRDHRCCVARRLDERRRPPARARATRRRTSCRSSASTSSSRRTPVLADVRPAGAHLVEQARTRRRRPGGAARARRSLLDRDADHDRRTDARRARRAPRRPATSSRPLAEPLKPAGGLAVLRGSLAPRGAVLKVARPTRRCSAHRGRAVVFEDIDDVAARIDDPDLDVDARLGARAPQRRTDGRAGHAGVGHAADPRASCSRTACATWCASPTRA